MKTYDIQHLLQPNKYNSLIASPYILNDFEPDNYKHGVKYKLTSEEYIESLEPLLKLLATELENSHSKSTIKQIATHLRIMADQSRDLLDDKN